MTGARRQSDLQLGVIGNCAASALVDREGTLVWGCAPRFDSNPLFCRLLDNGTELSDPDAMGFFAIELDRLTRTEQRYLHNTPILITTLYDDNGSSVEIVDFAPRYKTFGRVFRPLTLIRMVRPLSGEPRITIRLRPAEDYGARRPHTTRGSNHIRYVGETLRIRLTTELPLSFIQEERPFMLEEPAAMVFGPDETLTEGPLQIAHEFKRRTEYYWQEWCRYLSVPFDWQEAVIRAAVTLKLCSFEESGAVIAAMTTSIPEAADSGRNWDYRYCWLRDAYFVVHALNRLGATRTMEGFLRWIVNVVASSDNGHLQPVYGVTLEADLVETMVDSLKGYREMGPVRVGNQAYEHIQNDIYGSVILAATQSFFDARLVRPGTKQLFKRLEHIGEIAVSLYDKPDAGLWEFRAIAKVHTYTALMAWAGCDRLAKIAARLGEADRVAVWSGHADTIRAFIEDQCWSAERGCFVDSVGGDSLDASILLMHEVGFIDAADPRFIATVDAVGAELRRGPYLFRYNNADDFGRPENAFNICTFWYIDALAAIGRKDEARDLFENMLARRNHLGLLSEDIDPETGELWGNFPQTYSMVGLINSAMRLSRTWEEVL